MKKRHNLPITTPDFVCYNHLTLSNAIIKANAEEAWLFIIASKYLNCYYENDSEKHKFVISIYDHWCTSQKVMQSQSINLFKESYKNLKLNIVAIIKQFLNNGSYVMGQCNRLYIESNCDLESSLFDYVITGYDDISHEFMIYGIDSEDNYISKKIEYKNFISALLETHSSNIYFTLWRYTKSNNINIDVPNIIFELEDYLNSANRRNQYADNKVYGLDSIKLLAYNLFNIDVENYRVNEMYLTKLLVHKEYMEHRLNCLAQNKIIASKWIDMAKKVTKLIMSAIAKYQEFIDTHDDTLTKSITYCINESIRLEKLYLNNILSELKLWETNNTV